MNDAADSAIGQDAAVNNTSLTITATLSFEQIIDPPANNNAGNDQNPCERKSPIDGNKVYKSNDLMKTIDLINRMQQY